MISKKNNVNIENLDAGLLQFLSDMSTRFKGIVVSSGNDSVHMIGSRHYVNKAIDIGANSSDRTAYANFRSYVMDKSNGVKEKYGIEDIVNEGDHIHIEMPLNSIEKVKRNINYAVIGGILIALAGYIYYIKNKL